MNRYAKKLLITAMSASILSLAACSDDAKKDDGTSSNVQMSGAVVDDFAANSKVYVDINNNYEHDANFEPYAYTDGDGYFSRSAPDADGNTIDYCADPRKYEFKYCLAPDESAKSGAIIRSDGGIDLVTLQKVKSNFSLTTDNTTNSLFVSVLSQMKEAFDSLSEADQTAILTANNATTFDELISKKASVAGTDFKANTANFLEDEDLFKFAFKFNKFMDMINSAIEKNGDSTLTAGTTRSVRLASVRDNASAQDSCGDGVYVAPVTVATAQYLTNDVLPADDVIEASGCHDSTENVSFTSEDPPVADTPSIPDDKQEDVADAISSVVGTKEEQKEANENPDDVTKQTPINKMLDSVEAENGKITDSKKAQVSSELATNSVDESMDDIKEDKFDDTAKANLNKKVTTSETIASDQTSDDDIDAVDFATLNNNVQDNPDQGASAVIAGSKTVSFETVVLKDGAVEGAIFKDYGLNLEPENQGDDHLKVYFNYEETNLDSEGKVTKAQGRVILCKKPAEGEVEKLEGNWSWNKQRPAVMLADYLATNIIIKRLDTAATGCDEAGDTGSCVNVEYPNTDKQEGEADTINSVFADTTNLDDPSTSTQLFNRTNDDPDTNVTADKTGCLFN